jgi:hypothetical protein
MPTLGTDTTSRRRRPLLGRTRALLAGGLIAALGIGGTLAVWNTAVLGEATVRGGDAAAKTLEIRDANGNWVTGDGQTATLIADLQYPSAGGGPDFTRLVWGESRLRLTGPGEGVPIELSVRTELTTAFPADVSIKGFLTPRESGTCQEAAISGDIQQVAGIEPGDGGSSVVDLQVTGPMDLRLCFRAVNASSAELTPADVDRISFEFTANGQ